MFKLVRLLTGKGPNIEFHTIKIKKPEHKKYKKRFRTEWGGPQKF
jgi:hypothetical protein